MPPPPPRIVGSPSTLPLQRRSSLLHTESSPTSAGPSPPQARTPQRSRAPRTGFAAYCPQAGILARTRPPTLQDPLPTSPQPSERSQRGDSDTLARTWLQISPATCHKHRRMPEISPTTTLQVPLASSIESAVPLRSTQPSLHRTIIHVTRAKPYYYT